MYWMSRFYVKLSAPVSVQQHSPPLTASTPAWLLDWLLDPPSRVWRVKVVEDEMSVRNLPRNV